MESSGGRSHQKELADCQQLPEQDPLLQNTASPPDYHQAQAHRSYQEPEAMPHNYIPQNQTYPPQQPPVPQAHTAYPQTIIIQPRSDAGLAYVEDYMIWSVLNCLCCCWILGIAAIITSYLVRTEKRSGNLEGARKNSRIAFGINIAASISGVVLIIVLVATLVTLQKKAKYYYEY